MSFKVKFGLGVLFIAIFISFVHIIFGIEKISLKNQATRNKIQETRNKKQEINKLEGVDLKGLSFDQLKEYFTDLASTQGALKAFEVLKNASLPPNTDLHLLGHIVGDILYKQKGVDGMQYCTQDFRNACSHTIVVGLFLDKGSDALPEIQKACQKAPGGSGAYNMCFHGLGHGILAYTGYKLDEAFRICESTKTENGREYPECVGGIIMEQISGGDHDKQTWSKQRAVNLKTADPLFPCNSERVQDFAAKKVCYTYLTPYLFELGGPMYNGIPSEESIKRAFGFCDLVPLSQANLRQECMGGFGKEFVVLAQDRDIRKVGTASDAQLKKVISWCLLAPDVQSQHACIEHGVSSLFWGGENDSRSAIRFCSLQDPIHQKECFNSLKNSAKYYLNDSGFEEFCTQIPENYSCI